MAAHGRPAGLNSSKSPLSVRVLWTVPAGSSMTECADRHAERRHGGTLLLTFLMRCLRSRYARSIGNCMPKVCTDSLPTVPQQALGARWATVGKLEAARQFSAARDVADHQ